MQQLLEFDLDLIRRYDKSGPRYTSYPTAIQFHEGFDSQQYARIARASNDTGRPLSLYFHIPFCDTLCFYCACSKIATKNRAHAAPYLADLHREIALQAALFDDQRVVDQLHWGGGTPTFISHDQMRELMAVTRRYFKLHDDDQGEYSIEIDPREVRRDTLKVLRQLGFNRLSMGVQDFDERVQKAVNRIQSEEQTFQVLQQARDYGFKSVSLDLIYGLPFQSVDSFLRTLDKVIAAEPDRLSVFNYAHLPEMFKPQRRINVEELPSAAEKLAILQATIERLAQAGYVFIGMDHFARPDDELAIAQRQGSLYRNFQGYSTHADCDLIGLGVTSIGKVANSYGQNAKTVDEYHEALSRGELPLIKGLLLDEDDILRRQVMTALICHFELRYNDIALPDGVLFGDYFSSEMLVLGKMENDGLLLVEPQGIRVLPRGRLLIRNICMVFDRYLKGHAEHRFSRVI